MFKFCNEHSQILSKNVEYFGLKHLISSDHEGIIKRALNGSYDSFDDFDPLLLVKFHIFKSAITNYGVSYMKSYDDVGQCRCALCEYALHDGNPDVWIENAMITAFQEARRLGFTTIQ